MKTSKLFTDMQEKEEDMFLELLDNYKNKDFVQADKPQKENKYDILELKSLGNNIQLSATDRVLLMYPGGFSLESMKKSVSEAWRAHFMLDDVTKTPQEFQQRMYYNLVRYTSFKICIRDIVEITISDTGVKLKKYGGFKNNEKMNANFHFGKVERSSWIELVVTNELKNEQQVSLIAKNTCLNDFVKHIKEFNKVFREMEELPFVYYQSLCDYLNKMHFKSSALFELELDQYNLKTRIE